MPLSGTIPLILVILFIALAVFGVYQVSTAWAEAHQAAWQMEAAAKAVANAQLYQIEAQEAMKRAQFWTEFYRVIFVVMLGIVMAGALVFYWKVVDERTESKARMVDGSFSLQMHKGLNGEVFHIDPNKALFGVTGFNKNNGQLTTDAAAVGPDRQLEYAKTVQKTRTANATTGTDGVRNSAQAKLAAGYYDRPQQPRIVD
ncbi:MAG: hypothetical protein NT075_30945, partial [Chloroflexi bacterium]|nr:hypothetical protein [Chloroflexota bacterium]